MNIDYEEIEEQDLPALTHVMTRAFDADARLHLGQEKGGPEGYDNGDFFHQWLLPYKESQGFKIIVDGQIVGAYIVWILESGDNFLGVLFVDPDYQNRGIGTQAWRHIERTYPETRSWTLETPSWATRNHYFYAQKCGFVKIEEREAEDHSGANYVYRKERRQPAGKAPGTQTPASASLP